MFIYASDVPNSIFIKLNKHGNKVLRVNDKKFTNSLPKNYKKDCIYLAGDTNVILEEEEYDYYCEMISKYKLSKIIKEYPQVKGKPLMQKLMHIALYAEEISGLNYRLKNNIISLVSNLKGNTQDESILAGTEIPYEVYHKLLDKYNIGKQEELEAIEDSPKEELEELDDSSKEELEGITPRVEVNTTPKEELEGSPKEEQEDEVIMIIYNALMEEAYDIINDKTIDYVDYGLNAVYVLLLNGNVMKVKENKVEELFQLGNLKAVSSVLMNSNIEDYFENLKVEEPLKPVPEYKICELSLGLVFDKNLNVVEDFNVPTLAYTDDINIVVIDDMNKLYYPISDLTDIDVVVKYCNSNMLDEISIGLEY